MNNEFSEREARVRESFSRQGFMRHLSAEVSKLGPGECEIQVPYREEMVTIQTSRQCRQRFLLGKTQGIGRPGLLKTFAFSECDIVRVPRLEGVLRNKGAQAKESAGGEEEGAAAMAERTGVADHRATGVAVVGGNEWRVASG